MKKLAPCASPDGSGCSATACDLRAVCVLCGFWHSRNLLQCRSCTILLRRRFFLLLLLDACVDLPIGFWLFQLRRLVRHSCVGLALLHNRLVDDRLIRWTLLLVRNDLLPRLRRGCHCRRTLAVVAPHG